MIYSNPECNQIKRVIRRKEMEKVVYSSMEQLPIAVRTSMEAQLDLDIRRCHAM
ncbi:hypothetical protein AUP07_0756 [methanogenic archaeon mixed culture ISO4-G1]|nr:hypothetical protein AUP07_0756 [methanogenic archaeon mixed culture ISO4-G1]